MTKLIDVGRIKSQAQWISHCWDTLVIEEMWQIRQWQTPTWGFHCNQNNHYVFQMWLIKKGACYALHHYDWQVDVQDTTTVPSDLVWSIHSKANGWPAVMFTNLANHIHYIALANKSLRLNQGSAVQFPYVGLVNGNALNQVSLLSIYIDPAK